MTAPKKPRDGDNMEPIKAEIRDAREEVDALKEERASINDKIKAVRSNLETKGIKKEAFNMALRYMDWDEDKRRGFDLAYAVVREALGAAVDAQGDLFGFAEQAGKAE